MDCTTPPYLRLPRLRFMAKPGPAPGTGQQQQQNDPKPKFVDAAGKTWDFPAETPVKDMTDAERAEYYHEKAKKHEKNRAPDNIADLIDKAAKYDAAALAGQPLEAQQIAAATAEGEKKGRLAVLPQLIKVSLKSALPDATDEELDEIIDDLDVNKFALTDGRADQERIDKLATKYAVKAEPGATQGQQQQSGDPLANALEKSGQPGASGAGGGSIASLREQAREQLTPKPKS